MASDCIPHQVNARVASALSELARDNPANQSAAAQAGSIAYVALRQGTCMTRESRGWPLCTRLACKVLTTAHPFVSRRRQGRVGEESRRLGALAPHKVRQTLMI